MRHIQNLLRPASLLAFVSLVGFAACGTDGSTFGYDPEADGGGGSSGSPSINTGDGGGPGRGDGEVPPPACGNGKLEVDELCDDGNNEDGDGCSADCKVIEEGYLCSQEGAACAPLCGDGLVRGNEACDDKNSTEPGCDDNCQIEWGYHCPTPGEACVEAVCGNSVREGLEQCDDGNDEPYDGCFNCRLEPVCNGDGCQGVCGDGLIFPGEECDDGNTRNGDGCSSTCKVEPGYGYTNPSGEFVAGCETIVEPLPNELVLPVIYRDFKSPWPHSTAAQVDFGETMDPAGHPDFEIVTGGAGGATLGLVKDRLAADGRPVFDYNQATDPNCATAPGGRERGCPALTGAREFYEWYHKDRLGADGMVDPALASRNVAVVSTLTLPKIAEGVYQFDSAKPPYGPFVFFPIDEQGWGVSEDNVCRQDVYDTNGAWVPGKLRPVKCEAAKYFVDANGQCRSTYRNGCNPATMQPEQCTLMIDDPATDFDDRLPHPRNYECITTDHSKRHNFLFTSELHFWFTYSTPTAQQIADGEFPKLEFSGDDDVWIFINGRLALDLGGIHGQLNGSYELTPANAAALGLVDGGIYDIALFHAERKFNASNFKFTLGGFLKKSSLCTPVCGDGIKTANETCDDGVLAGGYNQCDKNCVWGPRCGDGVVQPEHGEQCDDGNFVDNDGCAPDCRSTGGPIN